MVGTKTKKLIVLGQTIQQRLQLGNEVASTSDVVENAEAKDHNSDGYGGEVFDLPESHKAGMKVPKGGSSCANCKFSEMKEDGPHCHSEYWVRWNGGETRLPVDDPETYCSDFWEARNNSKRLK